MDNEVKMPPIGLMPKRFYEKQANHKRIIDVISAINRYIGDRLEVPIEWVEEYNELIDYFNNQQYE